MSRMKATKWFHCRCILPNTRMEKTVNTVSVITSCITFSCIRLNGPPLPSKPMRLAGTCRQYSTKAIAQLMSINAISPILANRGICAIFRCPYHANVIKIFDISNNIIGEICLIIIRFYHRITY